MRQSCHTAWAINTFGKATLGDPRRTQRLIKLSAAMAANPGCSIVKTTDTSADMEGAYRFLRNELVDVNAIAEAGFQATIKKANQYGLLLALEDTTTLSYQHRSLRDELGHLNQGDRYRGLLAHSVLLYAPHEKDVIGLVAQHRWTRDITTRGKRSLHASTPYEEKEGYKWEQVSTDMSTRLGEILPRVISVCDREADIYEYLRYKLTHSQRFVVRSMQSRHIEETDHKLYHYASELQVAGQKKVHIAQKGGRSARVALTNIVYAPVTLKAPSNKQGQSLPLYYVGCHEIDGLDSANALSWHLLTSEPVQSAEDALSIIEMYEKRWLVEEYHKTWKSDGTDVENLRMQSRENIERMAVLQAFVAVRIMQLKMAPEQDATRCCEEVLSVKSWKLLWLKQEKKPLPETPPSLLWAYRTLASLGGWKDSKGTGKVSVKTLWQGWFKLQTILEGYELAQSLNQQNL